MRSFFLLFVVGMLMQPGSFLYGQQEQNPLDIYGYFQAGFDHGLQKTTIPMLGTTESQYNSFLVQQLNIMAAKRFNSSFSAFLNIEMTNNYSSNHNWGSLSLGEAWMKYEYSAALNIKAGLLIPTFNNLHEIKNRTPLLPYIIRPLFYEAAASDVFDAYDFLPETAFLQVYGYVSVGEAKFDYAAYVGNSEAKWINSGDTFLSSIRGQDTSKFKLVGMRVGARVGRWKAGYSMTVDKDNQVSLGLGPVQRLRFGGDLSFQVERFSFESEIIAVDEPLTPVQQQTLAAVAAMNPEVGTTLDKFACYGNITYDFTDQWYAYVGYQAMSIFLRSVNKNDISAFTFGGGFRPVESVVLKGQYFWLKSTTGSIYESTMNRFEAVVSVVF